MVSSVDSDSAQDLDSSIEVVSVQGTKRVSMMQVALAEEDTHSPMPCCTLLVIALRDASTRLVAWMMPSVLEGVEASCKQRLHKHAFEFLGYD